MEKINVLKDVVLEDSAVCVQSRAVTGENVDYSSFEVSHGYGQLLKAGAKLTKGVVGTLKVDIKVSSYMSTSYKAVTDEVRTVVDQTILDHLDESEKKKNYSDWWLWFHSKNESEYEHHKNQSRETITDTDETKLHALQNNFSEERQEYRVQGEFQVEGLSSVPTEVFLYVEILNVTTKDGNTTHVINSTAVPATADGDTSAAKINGDGKLNIIPL